MSQTWKSSKKNIKQIMASQYKVPDLYLHYYELCKHTLTHILLIRKQIHEYKYKTEWQKSSYQVIPTFDLDGCMVQLRYYCFKFAGDGMFTV